MAHEGKDGDRQALKGMDGRKTLHTKTIHLRAHNAYRTSLFNVVHVNLMKKKEKNKQTKTGLSGRERLFSRLKTASKLETQMALIIMEEQSINLIFIA